MAETRKDMERFGAFFMLNAILGTKQKMTQVWIKDGHRVPVTIVQASPVVVTQIKTEEKDGYKAIQIGFGTKKTKNTSKPLLGHLKKIQNDNAIPRFIREVKPQDEQPLNVGDVVKVVDVLSSGDVVEVTGVSKGKGFQGGVKRWGFRGGPRTHGQSDRERAPGSIGQTTTPGRVFKGKKMAGRMGGERVTVKNLVVLEVSGDVLKLVGLVPGGPGTLLSVKKVGHDKRFDVDEVEEKEGESHE